MPYTFYNTAQGWKNLNPAGSTDPQTMVNIDLLGALTPLEAYTPYHTADQWQGVTDEQYSATELLVTIDTLGEA